MKVAFLILHYNEIELTKKAIKSILEMESFCEGDREIVIVDNCSPNGSGAEIIRDYKATQMTPKTSDESIEKYKVIINDKNKHSVPLYIILNKENGGFSKGNNVGFKFIRENMDADFIVALNNDITFVQKDFIKILSSIYEKKESKFYLAGPDVYTPHIRSHISPLYDRPRGIIETDEKIEMLNDIIKQYEGGFSFSIFFRYIQDKYQESKLLKLYNSIRKREYSGATCYDEPYYNCILNGACLIVDKRFIAENDIMFEEKTFLYAEEDFITKKLSDRGQMIRYCPEIIVDHVGQGTSGFTKTTFKTYKEKNIATTKRVIEAFMAYRKYCEEK